MSPELRLADPATSSPWNGIAAAYGGPPQGLLGSHVVADSGVWDSFFRVAPAAQLAERLTRLLLAVMQARHGELEPGACCWLNRASIALAAGAAVLCHQRDVAGRPFGPTDLVLAASITALEAAARDAEQHFPPAVVSAIRAAFTSFPAACWSAAESRQAQHQTVYDRHGAMMSGVGSSLRAAFPDGLRCDRRLSSH